MTDVGAVWRMGIAERSAEFRAGRLDPVMVLEASLERIGRVDPQSNTIVAMDAAGARAARGCGRRVCRSAGRSWHRSADAGLLAFSRRFEADRGLPRPWPALA